MKTILIIAALAGAGFAAYHFWPVVKAFALKVIAKIRGN